MKKTLRQTVEEFHEQTPGLRFISGKWFSGQNEVLDINRYLARVGAWETPKAVRDAAEMFVLLYGEEGDWLEMPIVTAAREQKELYPMAFPLTREQLMIIRIMLEGKEEAMFICTGQGGTGKSTFLNIVRQIYGNDCSAVTLDSLTGFNIAEAVKHRLIASDELAAGELDNAALKTIISKQPIQVNGKFQVPFQMRAQSALFFCCNVPPRIDIGDTGILRRIFYYSREKKIENPDLSLKSKHYSPSELQNIVAHALKTDITNWRDTFKEDTVNYLSKNNSVRISGKALYQDYLDDCKEKGLKAYSEPKWQQIYDTFREWGVWDRKKKPPKEEDNGQWVSVQDKCPDDLFDLFK